MSTVERLQMSVWTPQVNFGSRCKKVVSHPGVPQTPKEATVCSVNCECVYLSVPNTFSGCGVFLRMCEHNIFYLCSCKLIHILCGIFHQSGLCSWLHLVMQLILCSSSSNNNDSNNDDSNSNNRRCSYHHQRLQPASPLHWRTHLDQ